MRVRMLVDASGNRNGLPWPARGETIDLPDEEATGYCAAGLASPVADTDPAGESGEEMATPPPPERREEPVTTKTGPARRATRAKG